MLCKICNYIDKIESPEYEKLRNDRSFSINVAADLYVESLIREREKCNYGIK